MDWIIQFRRPLRPSDMSRSLTSETMGWTADPDGPDGRRGKCIRYWNALDCMWYPSHNLASRYRTRQSAESAAFCIAARDMSLLGEIGVTKDERT
jgi:hypothetical protein